MDCWIASFPRSGNTFFRNILYYVYGIESSTWHKETSYPVDDNYDSYRFVKTHLLPGELNPGDTTIPAIYLVRDGRDAIVSIAHHKRDLVDPGSDYELNLREAIIAAEGSYFGGWSANVSEWSRRADMIIRYEDLIAAPREVFARVGKLISLPEANWNNLPNFKEMKSGKPKYGGISKSLNPKYDPEKFAEKFFRKGKTGSWKDDMPDKLQDLFWNYHGDAMERMGYDSVYTTRSQHPMIDYMVMMKMGLPVPQPPEKRSLVIIEASKKIDRINDGIKRYVEQLLNKFEDVMIDGYPAWEFRLVIGDKIFPLAGFTTEMTEEEPVQLQPYEKKLLGFKDRVRNSLPQGFYRMITGIYKGSGIRIFLRLIQRAVTYKPKLTLYRQLMSMQNEIALYHIPLPQNFAAFKRIKHNFLVTVHDITHKLFPHYHDDENVRLAASGFRFIVKKKAEVIGVSKNTIDDLLTNYPVPAQRTHLVYEAPDRQLFRWSVSNIQDDIIRNKYGIGNAPYFLCLSTIEPRKNLPNTIRAFNRFAEENPGADVNLVIAGNFGWMTDHLSSELHLNNPRIRFTGYIEDDDLYLVYSNALALCYVSIYEGFGLPPLEAMSCRTPVIYGDNSSMREIIGDAGLPAEAGNIESIKAQMKKMYEDKALRENLATLSHRRSFDFSWRKSLFETLQAYKHAIENYNTQS